MTTSFNCTIFWRGWSVLYCFIFLTIFHPIMVSSKSKSTKKPTFFQDTFGQQLQWSPCCDYIFHNAVHVILINSWWLLIYNQWYGVVNITVWRHHITTIFTLILFLQSLNVITFTKINEIHLWLLVRNRKQISCLYIFQRYYRYSKTLFCCYEIIYMQNEYICEILQK